MPRTKYFWFRTKRMHAGHAALVIDCDLYNQGIDTPLATLNYPGVGTIQYADLYVSWVGRAGTDTLKGMEGINDRDYYSDQITFGEWHQKGVNMYGLDARAMIREWRMIRNGGHHWRFFDKNCASVVRRVLKAGGANRYVHHPLTLVGIASPAGLYRYAKDVAKHGPQA